MIHQMAQKATILELHRAQTSRDAQNKEVPEVISTLTNVPDQLTAGTASAVTKTIVLRVVTGIETSTLHIIPAITIITRDNIRNETAACLRQCTMTRAISLLLMPSQRLTVSIIVPIPVTMVGRASQIGQAPAKCHQTTVSSDGEVGIQAIAANPGNATSDLTTNLT